MAIKRKFHSQTYAGDPLTPAVLGRQSLAFRGSGGVSAGNRAYGFAPAFLDTETGQVYLARYADGRLAPMHLLEGLPDELILERHESGAVQALKPTVIAGFLRCNRFFTRDQAAQYVASQNSLTN